MLISPSAHNTRDTRWNQIWDFLTSPNAAIQEPGQRFQARFLSAITLILSVTTAITSQSVGPMLLGFFLYFLSRTKYTTAVLILLITSNVILLFSMILAAPDNSVIPYYLLLIILYTSFFLPLGITALFTVLIISGQLLITAHRPVPSYDVTTFLVFLSVLVLIFTHFRNVLEHIRRQQVADALQKVELLNKTLFTTNKELGIANALSQEAARLKSEFMATMSHELRTPLNAILGFSGILLTGMGGEVDADARHMIERTEANAKRLLLLINDVLDIAKIESGRLQIVSAPVSLRELAEGWRTQMGILAEQKQLVFSIEMDPRLPEQIYGDPQLLSQIAVNLLSNAFKFTDKGTVTLSLKCAEAKWEIEVSDTGIGIPPHALGYIFEEFRQLDGSSTRSYGGSGLGLAITRNLCRAMNGNITVKSILNVGSTFSVTLPLVLKPELQVA